MKKIITVIVIAMVLVACKSEQEKQDQIFASNIKKQLTDVAFKLNSKIEIMDLTKIKTDTIMANTLDSFALNTYFTKIDDFVKEGNEILNSMEGDKRMMRLSNGLSKDIYENSRSLFKEKNKKTTAISDSIHKYQRLDSIKRRDMALNPNKQKIYKAKYFLKAQVVYNSTNKTENILDTVLYFFNNKNEIIKP